MEDKYNNINLIPLIRIPNFRVLSWYKDYLYVSKGYVLYKINIRNIEENCKIKIERVASFKPNLIRKFASQNRILNRLSRSGFHFIKILDSKIIGIVAKHIVVFNSENNEFISTFEIKRGTRPFGIAATPEGKFYWGEYFDNKEREEVYIYGSEDGGYSWDVIYVFPKGSIRHIHNIYYDFYEDCFWVLTGDYDKEPKIIKFSIDWKIIDILYEGSQQARTVSMIFRKYEIFYFTDTELEQNYIYSIDRKTGKIERIFPLPGPSIYSSEAGKYMFVSTHSEPGKSFNPYAFLYGSINGKDWIECLKWRKDKFHPVFFQYGSIVLPREKTRFNYLATTGRAVKYEDGYLSIWRIED